MTTEQPNDDCPKDDHELYVTSMESNPPYEIIVERECEWCNYHEEGKLKPAEPKSIGAVFDDIIQSKNVVSVSFNIDEQGPHDAYVRLEIEYENGKVSLGDETFHFLE